MKLIFSNGKKIKVLQFLELSGAHKGKIGVYSLQKPFINADYIWVTMQRSKHPNEKKQDKPCGFSINDFEALALADMLIWNVGRRMNRRNVK